MACRDETRVNEAVNDIKKSSIQSSSSGNIKFMHLDLSDLKSVIKFVNEFFKTYDHVDILVNNAGLNTKGTSKQGLQQLFQVNYLGHYLLTRSLIHRQNQKANNTNKRKIRIVNLSSVTHHFGHLDYENSALNLSPKTSPYSVSKLYMNFLTYELNKRFSYQFRQSCSNNGCVESNAEKDTSNTLLKNLDILSVSANPGAVSSDIWRDWKGIKRTVLNLIIGFFLTVDEGSETAVYSACISEDEIISNQSKYALQTHKLTSLTNNGETNNLIGLSKHDIASMSLHMFGNKLIPYVVPYYTLKSWPSFVFEMMGVFAGPVFGPSSVPYLTMNKHDKSKTVLVEGIDIASSTLWDYSESLCKQYLSKEESYMFT